MTNRGEYLTTGGQEPDANGGLEGWAHNDIAQALTLMHSKPTLWNLLSSAKQSKAHGLRNEFYLSHT
jgi:hypothetical protein